MVEGVKFTVSAVDDATAVLKNINTNIGKLKGTATSITSGLSSLGSPLKYVTGLVHSLGTKLMWVAGLAAGAATAGFVGLSHSILKATSEGETLKARLQTVAGTDWKGLWDWAQVFEKGAPATLAEVINAITRLKAYQIEPIATMPILGDFAGSMGRNITDAVEAVADAMMGEWERMKEFGLKRDMVETWAAGKGLKPFDKTGKIIDANTMKMALFGMMAERSAGGMARMMGTIEGKSSSLSSAISKLFMKIGDVVSPVFKKLIDALTGMIDKFNSPENIAKFKEWFDKAFSRENIAKAAVFFSNIVVWGKSAFGWLQDTVGKVGKFIGETWDFMGEHVKLFGTILKDVTKAVLMLKAAQLGFSLTQVFLSAAATLAAIPGMQAAAIGLAATGIGAGVALAATGIGISNNIVNDAGKILSGIGGSMGLTPFPSLPQINGMPNSPESADMANAFMSQYDAASALANTQAQGNQTLKTIAQNTGALVEQNNRLLDRIYGGGARVESAAKYSNFNNSNRKLKPAIGGNRVI